MTEPGAEPTAPEAPAPEAQAPEAAPTPAAPAWVPPDGGRRRSRWWNCCLIAAVVTAIGSIMLVVIVIGLIFLGSQAQAILGGTIHFGTGGTGCSVTDQATAFPASASIRSVAYLEEEVAAGSTITVISTFPDGSANTRDQAIGQAADCIAQTISSGLPPGHYGLEYRLGAEVLAKGGFDVTP